MVNKASKADHSDVVEVSVPAKWGEVHSVKYLKNPSDEFTDHLTNYGVTLAIMTYQVGILVWGARRSLAMLRFLLLASNSQCWLLVTLFPHCGLPLSWVRWQLLGTCLTIVCVCVCACVCAYKFYAAMDSETARPIGLKNYEQVAIVLNYAVVKFCSRIHASFRVIGDQLVFWDNSKCLLPKKAVFSDTWSCPAILLVLIHFIQKR